MNEKAKMLMERLRAITPTNLHVKTDAGWAVRENFFSVWFRHSPEAARYMLLPYFYNNRVQFTE